MGLVVRRENVPRRLIRMEAVIKFQDKNDITCTVHIVLFSIVSPLTAHVAVKDEFTCNLTVKFILNSGDLTKFVS